MPGPGGGGHGGGFGGGGHGGGFGGGHGGGFGGRGHGGGFGGRGGGFYHGPGRGGCFFFPFYPGGGCLSTLLLPLVCAVLAVVLLIGFVAGGFGTLAKGGTVRYSEEKMQDYANRQYQAIYDPSGATYEDNVLIVLTLNEDMQTYYCIGWVGDNLRSDVNNLFGDEYTRLGNAVQSSINGSGYQYSLGANLASVAEKMQAAIENLRLEDVYRSNKAESHTAGKVYNYSANAKFNAETVDTALAGFTEATDISMSIVVADSADVFGKSLNTAAIFALLLSVVLLVWAVVGIVRYVRRRNGAGQY